MRSTFDTKNFIINDTAINSNSNKAPNFSYRIINLFCKRMISVIRTLLQKFIDDIDSGNSNICYEDQSKILSLLCNIADKDQRMSKLQSAEYLGVSRSTFDNLVKDGFIPKGRKQEGFKELSWSKIDLDLYLQTQE